MTKPLCTVKNATWTLPPPFLTEEEEDPALNDELGWD